MANVSRTPAFLAAVFSSLWPLGLSAGSIDRIPSNIRTDNARISEVFEYALDRSPSFGDLLTTLEASDRIVYVDEGTCHRRELHGCLQLLPIPGGRNMLIHLDPRQPIRAAVVQLAHELYHAAEVAHEHDVVDKAGLRALYQRIGERSCTDTSLDCFETRGAVAFEALVSRQLGAWRERAHASIEQPPGAHRRRWTHPALFAALNRTEPVGRNERE